MFAVVTGSHFAKHLFSSYVLRRSLVKSRTIEFRFVSHC